MILLLNNRITLPASLHDNIMKVFLKFTEFVIEIHFNEFKERANLLNKLSHGCPTDHNYDSRLSPVICGTVSPMQTLPSIESHSHSRRY